MLVPVALLFFATLAAGVMAYGTHPAWAQFSGGYEFILFARRIQWPLAVLSLMLCLAMVALVIANKRRAWWLIGLAPVLMLFVHRFASNPAGRYAVVENPAFATAVDAAKFVADGDWVVGVRFADKYFAYPYAALFDTPVVIQAEHDERLMVMWSAYANRATALRVSRELRGTDLEVVTTPANALLVYNGRIGQFINGVTGLTSKGETPDGVREAVPVFKMTWKAWRAAHPETGVLVPTGARYAGGAPRTAVLPTMPMPDEPEASSSSSSSASLDTKVVVVGVKQPVAIRADAVNFEPLNLSADGVPVLVFRDPADGSVRAFDRRVDTDLRPQFHRHADRKHPQVMFKDADSGAMWDARGVAVEGPEGIKGKRLNAVLVEDGLYWGVMKHWYPPLELAPAAAPDTSATGEPPPLTTVTPPKPTTKPAAKPSAKPAAKPATKPPKKPATRKPVKPASSPPGTPRG